MPITNYDLMIDKEYLPGTLITATGGTVQTRFNNTGNILFFGLGVVTGSGERVIALPSTANDKFEGVLMHTNTYEAREGYSKDATTGYYGYPDKREVSIIRPGEFAQVAVFVDSATAINDPVYVRYSATPGTTGLAGCFRQDDGTTTALEVTGARFIKVVAAPTAGEMAISWVEFS